MKAMATSAVVLLACFQASAAGFDSSDKIYQGDLNGDGRIDLYVKSSRFLIVPLDDLSIVIGLPVKGFVLQYNGDGTFDLIGSLSASQKSVVSQWQSSALVPSEEE